MNITDVRVYEVNKGKMLASASITLDDTLVVTGFRIIDGSKGLFVANPSTQSDGSYFDTVFCLTKDGREEIEAAILTTYEAEQEEAKAKKPAPKYSRKK